MKPIILILLIIISNETLSLSNLTTDANDYCSKDSLDDKNYSIKERNDIRKKRDNNWYKDYKEIINFLKDPDNSSETFFEIASWEGPLLIILMILTLISIICFCLQCCGVFKKEGNNTKVFTMLGCIMLWIFLALFITSIVFFSMSEDLSKKFLCSVFKIPSSLIDGVNDTNNKFIGLANLKNTYSNLDSEVENLTSVQNELNNIIGRKLQSQTNEIWSKSIEVFNNYKSKEILDGEGVYRNPYSVLILTEGINKQIESDLSVIDRAATNINNAAVEGKNLAFNNTQFKLTLASFGNRLDVIIKAIEDFGNLSLEDFRTGTKYARFGYSFMIGFGLLSVVLLIVLFIILCLMCSKNDCWNCLTCGKVLLIVLGICLFIYTILIFIMMVGSVSVSGMCGFFAKFEENPDAALAEFPELNLEVKNIALLCLTNQATGNLSSAMISNNDLKQTIDYNRIVTILDGLSNFRKWKNDTSSSTISTAIEDQKIIWDQHEVGYLTDFANVNVKLAELNDLTSCGEKTYGLTIANCKDVTNCINIYDSGLRPPFVAPSCLTDSAPAKLIYDNLQMYLNHEVGLMNELQQLVSDTTNVDSVHFKYKLTKDNMIQANDDVSKVEAVLNNSLKFTREYNTNYKQLEDCRALRKVVLQFENEGCFRFNYYLYVFLVVSCVCALIWFFMLWCLCFALRSTEGEAEEKPVKRDPPKPVKEEPQNIDVDDKEKMPFY